MSEALLANALGLRRAGRLAEAAKIYSQILSAEPRHFDALHALGILTYQSGRLEEAERLIAEATLANPGAADAMYNHASLLLRLNRPEEALVRFGRALALKPDYAEALGNRGATLLRLARPQEALADFENLTLLKPNLAEAWTNRGAALVKLDRLKEAYDSFGKALAIKPNYPDVRQSRAALSFVMKNYADVLADVEQALSFNVKDAAAWESRGNALAELGRREDALSSYDEALRLKPDSGDALFNRAGLLLGKKRYEDAARDLTALLRLAPDYRFARGTRAFARLAVCEWRDLTEDSERVVRSLRAGEPASPPFQALALVADSEAALQAAHLFTKMRYPASSVPLWKGERHRHERIRLAYLSANFHDHAVARLMAGVFENHDRGRFETIAVSFGGSSDSQMRTRLRNSFDRFLDVEEKSARDIAQTLHAMEIDIAVDLMGFTEGCRPEILAERPAPLQVNFLGFPGTSGASYIDYILADRVIVPSGQQAHYTEKLAYLPHSYLPGDRTRKIAASVPTRSEAGLPEHGFVFCCFNNPYKFTPVIFDCWMRLLRDVATSVLWLPQADTTASRNLRREAEARGVAPERLVFAPFVSNDEDHLARLRLADLFLDTQPYNAHATASDALWAGVPLLAIEGTHFPGRVAASLLHALALPELIAATLSEYETRARELAQNPAAYGALRAKLAKHRLTQPLFDTARFTRDLEAAYLHMWKRADSGLPPASFAVEGAV